MAAYYVDTSALVKRYVEEVGTASILTITAPRAGHRIYTVRLTGPEMLSAFTRKVRTHQASAGDISRAIVLFRRDWVARFRIVEVTASLAEYAMTLVERHGLRGYDALHLAAVGETALLRGRKHLRPLTFLSSDHELLRVVRAEGLVADDPSLR